MSNHPRRPGRTVIFFLTLMKTNLNFWNRLCNAGFGPREDDRSSVLGGFLQIEPWNRLSASSAMLIAGACLLFLGIFASQASAQVDTLLATATFATGLPSTWTNDGSWSTNIVGRGGFNGSMVCTMAYNSIYGDPTYDSMYVDNGGDPYWEYFWNYPTAGYYNDLSTPSVNASSYASNDFSVWVDFDFFWAYNSDSYYEQESGNFEVSTDGSDLLDLIQPTNYGTYGVTGDPGSILAPDTSYWRHYHLLVPVASRTSDLTISFVGDVGNYHSTPAIDNVTITASATRRMSLSRDFVSLGQVRVGSRKRDTLNVSSTGHSSITVSSGMKSGVQFSSYPTSLNRSITNGSTEHDSVIFTPIARGMFSDSLIFTTNSDETSEQRMAVYVSGQGVQAIFNSTNGNALAFGNLRVGRTAQQTFSFSNTGDDTLFLQTPTISDSGFSIPSGPASLTILPNQTESIVLQFAPTKRRSYSGTLRFIASNGVTVPSVTLRGQGIQATFSPGNDTVFAFGYVHVGRTLERTFDFSNVGDDTLFLQTQSLAGNGFNVVPEPASLTLLPGQAGSFVVEFAPVTEQVYGETLSFTASNGVAAPTVTLSGTGALPHMAVAQNHETVDLGQVKVNSSNTQDFAVANTGAWDLTLSSASAAPTPFSIGTWPTIVAGNTTGYVAVNFAPTATGSFSGMLVIAGDDASNPSDTIFLTGTGIESALSIDPVNVDFGMVPVASIVRDTIKLSNTGTASVAINSYTLSPLVGTFAVVNSPAAQISAGGTALVIVSFHPDAVGNFAGTLTLMTDDAGTPVRTINLSGVGVRGTLAVASSIDFGNVMVGHDSVIRATLKNTSPVSVTINSLTMTGSAFSHGTFATPLLIAAGDSASLDLTFAPTIAGAASGSVRVTLGDNTLVNIALTGAGVSSADVVTGAQGNEFSLSISPNPANHIATAHISMMNASEGQLTVFDVTGHEVLSIPLGLLSQGAHDVTLPIEHLASGSYFVRITNTSGESASARLVLAR